MKICRNKPGSVLAGLLLSLMALAVSAKTTRTFEEIKAAAERGDPASQAELGIIYHDGLNDVQHDIASALEWFRKAAEQGHDEAQYRLGHEYATGHGVSNDNGKAFELFSQAAEQGHAEAQYRVGAFYNQGIEVPKDGEKALYWFSLAAENGSPDGQYMMGAHHHSRGDYAQALALFEQAAAGGKAQAVLVAAKMYYDGTTTQPPNYQKAAEILKPSIWRNANAMGLYGLLLLDGKGVEQDYKAGVGYLTRGAKDGGVFAMLWLADAMYDGRIVSENIDVPAALADLSAEEWMRDMEARYWYQQAADNGLEEAKQRLAERYP